MELSALNHSTFFKQWSEDAFRQSSLVRLLYSDGHFCLCHQRAKSLPQIYQLLWSPWKVKEHTWYALTDKWILARKLRILFRRGNKIPMEGVIETKFGTEPEGMTIQRLPQFGIHPIINYQTQTLADANNSLLTGTWYSCLLRGTTSAWQIQNWMFTVIHWKEHKVSNEGARESTQGAEEVWNPIGQTSIWTNQYLQSSLELNHQSKKTHGRICGSSCICTWGWPSQPLIGGEALGPVKVLCPSIGECPGNGNGWIGDQGRERG